MLDGYRVKGDELADNTVSALFEIGFNPLSNHDYANYQVNGQAIPSSFPPILKEYFSHIKIQSINDKLIKAGAAFFLDYAQPMMLCLGLYSLPYCYAAANGAKVLVSSERILKNPEKRLLETGDFVLDLHAPNAFEAAGKAFVSIAKVRLMHAAIRYHLLKSGKWHSEWGHPINQMDMAGTNYSFSLIVLRGLKKLGFNINKDRAEAYIGFWNEVGLLLGLEQALLPADAQEAYVLEQKIRKDQFSYSKEGEALTKALLNYIDTQETPFPLKGSQISAYLLGEELASLLGMEPSEDAQKLALPLKLVNRIQEQMKGSKASYERIVKEFEQKQKPVKTGEGRKENFQFLMALSD